ncbi:MAG: glycosyltransferase family 2 protein [Oceanobacter sp.]
MTEQSRFIIGVPTYNRSHLLERVVASAQAQTNTNWTLILVNDASSDDTEAVLTSYKSQLGEQLHFVSMPENSGVNAVRNRILDEARVLDENAWLVLIDDDDYLTPECLSVIEQHIQAQPGYSWYTLDCQYENGQRISRMKRHGDLSYLDDYMFGKTMRGDMTHVIKLSGVDDTRFSREFKNAEEWFFWCHLSVKHRLFAIDAIGSIKDYLPDGLTQNAFNRDKAIQVLSYKIRVLEPLVGATRLQHQYVSLAKHYIKKKDFINAKHLLKKCWKVNPFYFRQYRYLWVLLRP